MKKLSAMERAALALLNARCYPMGMPDDHFAFAGKHEEGCSQLVRGSLAETHPRGLMIYSSTCATLTSNGSAIGRQAYRLTSDGKKYAERVKAENAGRASA